MPEEANKGYTNPGSGNARNLLEESRDRELLRRIALNDDREAFRELIGHYQQRIYSASYKLTASHEISEEILQDVFVKIWLNRYKLGDLEHPFSYIYRTLMNTVYDHIRSNKHRSQIKQLVMDESEPFTNDMETTIETKDLENIIRQAVSGLTPQRRAVYELRFEQGLSYDEIAEKLQITASTARNTFMIAIQSIRKDVEKYHV